MDCEKEVNSNQKKREDEKNIFFGGNNFNDKFLCKL